MARSMTSLLALFAVVVIVMLILPAMTDLLAAKAYRDNEGTCHTINEDGTCVLTWNRMKDLCDDGARYVIAGNRTMDCTSPYTPPGAS